MESAAELPGEGTGKSAAGGGCFGGAGPFFFDMLRKGIGNFGTGFHGGGGGGGYGTESRNGRAIGICLRNNLAIGFPL